MSCTYFGNPLRRFMFTLGSASLNTVQCAFQQNKIYGPRVNSHCISIITDERVSKLSELNVR